MQDVPILVIMVQIASTLVLTPTVVTVTLKREPARDVNRDTRVITVNTA